MDFDEEILYDFTVQGKEHLASFEDDLLALEKQSGNPDNELVNKVFRVIHSIKGSAGFLGLDTLKELTHVMETLLSLIRSGEASPTQANVDALLQGADHISVMLDDIENSNEMDISGVYERLTALLADIPGAPPPSPRAPASGDEAAPPDPAPAAEESAATAADPNSAAAGDGAPEPLDTSVPPGSADTLSLRPAGGEAGGTGDLLAWRDFRISQSTLDSISDQHNNFYVLRYDLMDLEDRSKITPLEIIKILTKEGQILDGFLQNGDEDLHDGLPESPLQYNVLYATWLEDPDFVEVAARLPGHRIETVQPDWTDLPAVAVAEAPPAGVPSAAREGATSGAAPASSGLAVALAEPPMAETATLEKAPPAAEAVDAPPKKAPSPPASAKKGAAKSSPPLPRARESAESVRINVGVIDKLMTLAGELVLVRNRFLRSVNMNDPASRSLGHGLDIVTSELQESIMATRLQPIGNVFGKFPRVVRDIGRSLGKRIEIDIRGSEVELDKAIVEALGDPLTHLIRNSCDHGIESVEERQSAGKPGTGQIMLRAFHGGGLINIEIKDDGNGIDPEKIGRKAVEKGIRTQAELAEMSEKDILSLLFLPGFSTAEQVSDISGRGVGLDVVKTAVQGLGGTVDIESVPGEGTTFYLRLPLTLAIIPCLIIRSGDERFAIPQVNVEELVSLYDADVHAKLEYAGDREVYRLRDRLLPMVRLQLALEEEGAQPPEARGQSIASAPDLEKSDSTEVEAAPGDDLVVERPQRLIFAVLKFGGSRYGLVVDDVLGTEEIVVKPMHSTVKHLACYSGATVMGDGKVALILDVEGIAKQGGIDLDFQYEDDLVAEGEDKPHTQAVLLFRYGPEENFAVSLEAIRRIERIRMEDIQTVGRREFISIDERMVRVLRMENYLDISSAGELEDAFLLVPKEMDQPYGILVSSLMDIVDVPIELDTASYDVEGLQGSAIVDGRMTLVIGIPGLLRLAEQALLDHSGPALFPAMPGEEGEPGLGAEGAPDSVGG